VPHFSRRKIMIGIALSFNSGLLASCSPMSDEPDSVNGQPGNQAVNILADVAFTLFPHASLGMDIYHRIGEAILALDNPVIGQGLDELSAASSGNWLALNNSAKNAILEAMENSAFFGLVRVTAINVLYGTPELFDLVGYGGTAIEQGGYINRGLDDIDWLPAQEASL
jgi:hypothetical protein